MGFTKAHHRNPTQKESGRGLKQGEIPTIFEFPFNIFATAKASDLKFGKQFGFSKAHHRITPRKKWAWPWAKGTLHNSVFLFNTFATTKGSDFKIGRQVGFAKAITKSHPEEK